jgi:hypothetical protein
MATYKVPQDVEAEDKLIGPFTFRQFIFLIVAALSGYATFLAASISIPLLVIPLPFFIIFGVLGAYRRPDQPVELYLMALLRFYFKSHRRIWNPDGQIETVHITVPKKIEEVLTNGLSQTDVQSRLAALAGVMDTRGWSTKNVELQEGLSYGIATSDRLVMPQAPQEAVDIHPSDDILNPYSPTAQNISNLAGQATQAIRQGAVASMAAVGAGGAVPQYNPYPQAMQQQVLQVPTDPSTSTMTPEAHPDILRLSQNNDWSVSTIARQAEQLRPPSSQPPTTNNH